MRRELVITGFGAVLPPGPATLPEALGGGPGAACTDFSAAGVIPPMVNRRLDRASRLAWVAAAQALSGSGIQPGPGLGIAVATMSAGSEATEAFMRPVLAEGPAAASPLLFPNTVAVAVSGNLSVGLGLQGPGATVLGRENGILGAFDEASAWLALGMAEAVLVIGVDVLFPLLTELLHRTGRSLRSGLPEVGSGRGCLPGEGAQAFLVETRQHALVRGADIVAELCWAQVCPADESRPSRAQALRSALALVESQAPEAWIAGACGLEDLDALERGLPGPIPKHPKLQWGEFCGSGGQLLAAALVTGTRRVRITCPASRGVQGAMIVVLS